MKELKEAIDNLEYHQKNQRTIDALIAIVENLDYIPVEKLEELEEYFYL
jgi:predicted nuclease of restriction endonuclease-like RecB superfamily